MNPLDPYLVAQVLEGMPYEERAALLGLGGGAPDPLAGANVRGNADPLGGPQFSGKGTALRGGGRVPLVRGGIQGQNGMASVCVHTTDIIHGELANNNQKLVLFVRWNSGSSGGDAIIDCDRGCEFTVGGAETVEIEAQIVSGVLDASNVLEALIADTDKFVEATIHWGTGISPKAAKCSLPTVRLSGAANGPFQEIPLQAESAIVLCDTTNAYATLVANFQRNQLVGAGTTVAKVLNPFANGTPIVNGMRSVGLESPVACKATVVCELWL